MSEMRRALFALLFCFTCSNAWADKRVALVIGNSAYSKVTALPNPKNDAAAMVTSFEQSGFSVTPRNDLSIDEMRRAMRDFTEMSSDADVAVIYYAGHGIEVDGINYLVPIDAKLARDIDVEDEALSMDRLMRSIDTAKNLRLIILDACRDNPFAQSMKRTVASRSIGRGLAKVEPMTSNTLVAFAAKAGSTAADGDGGNSPFTASLIKNITVPGLDLRIALGRVRDEVLSATSRRQEPFVYGSLGGSIISLVPAPLVVETGPASTTSPADTMRRDYELAAQIGTQQAFESFLEAFPTGFYANLAKSQLAKAVAAKKADAEAAEAKAKADAAAAAAKDGDEATRRKAAIDAQKAKSEADIKAAAAAKAETARRREAERAAKQATRRATSDVPSNNASPNAQFGRSNRGTLVVSEVPARFSVGVGRRVLINNGQCPSGQILEMIGGNPSQGVKRSFRCIPR